MADNNNNSGMNAIVAIVAVIVIALLGYYAIQMLQQGDTNPDVNVDIPTPTEQQ